MDSDSIIDAYGRTKGLNPLDVLVAREKMTMIIQLWDEVARVLTADELEDTLKYIVDRKKYGDIGYRKMKLLKATTSVQERRIASAARTRGYRRVKAIMTKLRNIDIPEDVRDALNDNASEKTAWVPKWYIGWPMDWLREFNAGCYWAYPKKKKPEYRTKVVCMIPEYLSGAFGDSDTKCSLCGIRCTRRDMKRC